MYFKSITIEGVEGDVTIAHTDHGAMVTEGNRVVCELLRTDDDETRYRKAREVAKVVCGTVERSTRYSKAGEPNATNSMIHDVLAEMERVAG